MQDRVIHRNKNQASLDSAVPSLPLSQFTMSTQTSPQKESVLQKHDNDVVIVSAVRSAITKVRYHHTPILNKYLTHPLFSRAGKVVSKTPSPSSSSHMCSGPSIQRQVSTLHSSKTSLWETASYLEQVRATLVSPRSMPASQWTPPSTLLTDSAPPV